MINFFILCAGKGLRALPLSHYKAKPLFPLCTEPLVKRMISQLQHNGIKQGNINLFYKADQIKAALANENCINWIPEDQLSGSKILSDSRVDYDQYLLVVNGDIYLEIPVQSLLKTILKTNAAGVLLVRESNNLNYSSLQLEDDRFLCVNKQPGNIMYTGVALFSRKVLQSIQEINFFDSLKKNCFDIRVLHYRGIWLDLGSPQLYFDSHHRFADYYQVTAADFSFAAEISENSTVTNSIIWENVVIRDHSYIRDCIVTDNQILSNKIYKNKIICPQGIFDL
jgi:MurNAc alpha-1-phosphate uridylyltransferase